jgi:hypothetical protein
MNRSESFFRALAPATAPEAQGKLFATEKLIGAPALRHHFDLVNQLVVSGKGSLTLELCKPFKTYRWFFTSDEREKTRNWTALACGKQCGLPALADGAASSSSSAIVLAGPLVLDAPVSPSTSKTSKAAIKASTKKDSAKASMVTFFTGKSKR